MRTNTAPRIPRDRWPVGKAYRAQLLLAVAAFMLLYLIWEGAMRLAGR